MVAAFCAAVHCLIILLHVHVAAFANATPINICDAMPTAHVVPQARSTWAP